MSKHIVLKSECEFNELLDQVIVRVFRREKSESERWPKSELIGSEFIPMKNWLGYKSVQDLAREIVKAQNKILKKTKDNQKYFNLVHKLANAYSGHEIILQDGQTSKMVEHFTGDKK